MSSTSKLIKSISKFHASSKLIKSISKFHALNTRVLEQRRKFSTYNNVRSDPPSPSHPPPTSSMRWILGTTLAVFLPFAGNKWGPLLQFKQNVDTVVETIEEIVEVVEKAAEVVDKVAENISGGMPEDDRRLKKLVDVVEDVAEKTVKDAQTVGNAIDKFQEVEEKVGNIVDIMVHKSNGIQHTKDAKG